jgi:hypothetical protein
MGLGEREFAMVVPISRRGFLQVSAAGSLGVVAGCGTLMHPERRYAPNNGHLDWGIVALDTLGLLLFFLPGVIAFAVDFTTGAIYLPPEGYGDAGEPTKPGDLADDEQLVEIQVPRKELTQARVEEVASRHAGRDVRLVAGTYTTSPLTKLSDFWTTRARLMCRG